MLRWPTRLAGENAETRLLSATNSFYDCSENCGRMPQTPPLIAFGLPTVPNPQHFDILVIGSGPGGEGAAMQAVKHGKQVAVVERFDSIGGGCTHWGTI